MCIVVSRIVTDRVSRIMDGRARTTLKITDGEGEDENGVYIVSIWR